MNKNLNGVKLLVIFFMMQIVAGMLAVSVMTFSSMTGVINEAEVIGPALNVLCWFEFFFIAYIFYKNYDLIKVTTKQMLKDKRTVIAKVIKYLILYFGVIMIASLVDSVFLSKFLGFDGENQQVIEDVMASDLSIWIVISMTINAPIIEEYVFRYGVIDNLFAGLQPKTRLIGSSILFAMIHIGISQVLAIPLGAFIHLLLIYLPMAFVLGYIYLKEQNLFYSMVIHGFNNIIGVIAILITINTSV